MVPDTTVPVVVVAVKVSGTTVGLTLPTVIVTTLLVQDVGVAVVHTL